MRFLLILLVTFSLQAETLSQKQHQFSQLAASLITHAKSLGYEVTFGEAWRSTACAKFEVKWNEEHGIGISNSLHTQRLAIDINLFRSGKFLTATKDYEVLGAWWEKQCNLCRWGGRFKLKDGVHFSLSHGGVQ